MVDISEKIGRVSCSELQKEFSANDVMFLPTDVTNRDQLVGHVGSLLLASSVYPRMESHTRNLLKKYIHESIVSISSSQSATRIKF